MQTTAFGRYQLFDLLGRGGMGQVYRAYDTGTHREVALKLLPPELAGDAEFQQRFRREAHAIAGLKDPHVVPIHDYGEIDGRLYVDMRLVDGTDLEGLLQTEVLDPPRAVDIVEQVAAALDAAHRAGLVHRDVKPANILVGARDFTYLIDFGLARRVDATRLTSAGQTMGTVAYMAPERFDTGDADVRSDVYSLTCVLHQCLTGQRPFSGDTLQQQITGHLLTAPPRPSTVRPELGTAFDAVIAVGMAKSPAQRFKSPLDLAAAARDAVNGIALDTTTVAVRTPPVATTMLPVERRHRRGWLLGVVAVLLVAGGVVGGLQWHRVEQERNETAAVMQRVRGAIERYDLAIQNGNLTALREMTCGAAHDRYQHDTVASWDRAHAEALKTGQFPIDAGISHVTVKGDSASADVAQYQSATPQNHVTRSFELRRSDGSWKICADGR